jgi:Superinfection immunity protein
MITLTLLLALYFLPTIVASHRGHNLGGILVLNFFFGWTGIGWMAMLLWALLADAPRWCVVPYGGTYIPYGAYTPYSPYGVWRRY